MNNKKISVCMAVMGAVLSVSLMQAKSADAEPQRAVEMSAADVGRWNFIERVAAKTISRFNLRENPQRYQHADPEFVDCLPSKTVLQRILFDLMVIDLLFQKRNYVDTGIPYVNTFEWVIPEALAQGRAMAGATDHVEATGACAIRFAQKAVSKAGDFDHSMLKKVGAILLASLKTDVCSAHKRSTLRKARSINTAKTAAQETFDLKRGISKYLARWVKKTVIKRLVSHELKKSANGEQVAESLSTIITRYALKPVFYVALAQAEKAVLG
jgi:hypothetical protein